MSDFLQRIAERTLGLAPVAQPVIAPMFAPEPMSADAASSLREIDEVVETPSSPALQRQQLQRGIMQSHSSPTSHQQQMQRGSTRSHLPTTRASEKLAPQPSQPPATIPESRTDRAIHSLHVQQTPTVGDAPIMPVQTGNVPAIPVRTEDVPATFVHTSADDIAVASDPVVSPSPAQTRSALNTASLEAAAEKGLPKPQREHSLPPFLSDETTMPETHIAITSVESSPAANSLTEGAPVSRHMIEPQLPDAMEHSSVLLLNEIVASPALEQITAGNQLPQGMVTSHIIHEEPITFQPITPHMMNGQRSALPIEPLHEDQVREEHSLLPQHVEIIGKGRMVGEGEAERRDTNEYPSPRPSLAPLQSSSNQSLLVPQTQPADLPQAALLYHDATERSQGHPSQASPQRNDAQGEQSAVPMIRVTIGRVEVRAISAPISPQRQQAPRPAPAVSLEQYARQNRERR